MNALDSAAWALDFRNEAAKLPDFIMSDDGLRVSCGDISTDLLPVGFEVLLPNQINEVLNQSMARLTLKALSKMKAAA